MGTLFWEYFRSNGGTYGGLKISTLSESYVLVSAIY